MNGVWKVLHRGFTSAGRGLAVTVILVLGLGIGANCALFSVLNSFLFRPLPYRHAGHLVEILQPPRSFLLDELTRARAFSSVAAYLPRGFRVRPDSGTVNLYGFRVTPNLFSTLGVEAAVGRIFRDDEQSEPVVIVSYDYWRRVSGDSNIIGREITIDEERRTVVGVLPADFTLQVRDANFFVPSRMEGGRIIARLRPGLSEAQAGDEVKAIVLGAVPAEAARGARLGVEPLSRAFRSNDAAPLWLLLGGSAMLLLITCVNVGNVLLVRANARRREFAIRAALGASRSQVLRQLLTENIVLAGAGGTLGILLAKWSSSFVQAQLPANIARRLRGADALALDYRVVLFALGAAILTVIAFGSAPAVAALRTDLISSLRGSSGADAHGRKRYGEFLVIAEIAIAVTLLIGSALAVKSLLGIQNQYLGFSPERVLRTAIELPEVRYPDPDQRARKIEGALTGLRGLPGVEEAGIVAPQLFPFGGPRVTGAVFEIRGHPVIEARAEVYAASPAYFRAVRIPLLKGRYFTDADTRATMPVALISSIVAKRYWGQTSPLGASVRLNSHDPASPWVTIVGVVGDVRNPVAFDVQPTAYRPFAQSGARGGAIMLRGATDPGALKEAVRREIRSAIPGASEFAVADLQQAVFDYVSPQRFTASVLGVFAILGLILAAAGVYGVMQHWVGTRIPELGIRIALGAESNRVIRLVMARSMRVILCGVALGCAAAVSLQKLIASQLYGVSPTDPAVLAGVALTMGFVGLAAALRPARWASRIDPVIALKYE